MTDSSFNRLRLEIRTGLCNVCIDENPNWEQAIIPQMDELAPAWRKGLPANDPAWIFYCDYWKQYSTPCVESIGLDGSSTFELCEKHLDEVYHLLKLKLKDQDIV